MKSTRAQSQHVAGEREDCAVSARLGVTFFVSNLWRTVCCKSVPHCFSNVRQECLTKSVRQECPTSVFYKRFPQGYPATLSCKSVPAREAPQVYLEIISCINTYIYIYIFF